LLHSYESLSNGKCDICGVNPKSEEIDNVNFCKYCLKFKEIGERLPKANYIKIDLRNWIDGFDLTYKKPNDSLYFGLTEYPIKQIANYVPRFGTNEILKNIKSYLILSLMRMK